jgi:hypothetical protein
MNFAKGYLTYALSALAVIGGISGYLIGIVSEEQAIGMVWAGLATFGIRRAM